MRAIRAKKPAPKTVSTTATLKEPDRKVAKPVSFKPRLSEKAYGLSESGNTYVFDLSTEVNKFDVAAAIAAQYGVSVVKVRLVSVPGKTVRMYRQRGRRSLSGKRSVIRKAYVTLKEGDSLPFFAAPEEASAPKETK